jgi:rhamnose utilization protein RhaD (predicted bifunctional aldolase and dehydrogenase)
VTERLQALVEMSRALGDPSWRLAILGEGNTSCRADADEFFVKASGHSLDGIGPEGFVRCRFAPILAAAAAGSASDEEVRRVLADARGDPTGPMPSIETFLHAHLLSVDGVEFVGHTHPVSVNALLCSEGADLNARLIPDHVVCCGPASCVVPYADPGLPLAQALKAAVASYVKAHGEPPRLILMQNHGMIALGGRPEEVISCSLMAEKAAQIYLGACAAGRPRSLTPENVERIHVRPDEAYRRERIGQTPPGETEGGDG